MSHAQTSEQCAAKVGVDAGLASTLLPLGASSNHTDTLPCGWALARDYPCLSPILYSWVSVASSASLVAGTVLYTSKFQSWSFRKIIFSTQLLLVLANLLDALWVSRLSRNLGVTDGLMAFGEEIFIDVVDAMNSQPFFIYAAKLCPHSVEASMFALFMGLSNFGAAAVWPLKPSTVASPCLLSPSRTPSSPPSPPPSALALAPALAPTLFLSLSLTLSLSLSLSLTLALTHTHSLSPAFSLTLSLALSVALSEAPTPSLSPGTLHGLLTAEAARRCSEARLREPYHFCHPPLTRPPPPLPPRASVGTARLTSRHR